MGGAERVTRSVAYSALASGRFDEVICFVLSRTRSGTLDDLERLPGARVIYTGAPKVRTGLGDLYRVCREGPFAFTFSSFIDINAVLCLFRRLYILRTERLVTRESTMFFERDFGWKTSLVRYLFKLYGAQDIVVCQTERMAASLSKNTGGRFHSKTVVLQNPLDFEFKSNLAKPDDEALIGVPPGRFKIVWCGRLAPVKSPFRAVETLRVLHDRGMRSAYLVIIGDGPQRGEVMSLVERLGLAEHVTLVGYYQYPARLMRQCQAGLVTSDVEGFPNVVLEMLAAGVTGVASTNCAGGLFDIPGLFVSQENTPAALADAVKQLRSFPVAPEDIASHLQNHSPEYFLSKLIEAK